MSPSAEFTLINCFSGLFAQSSGSSRGTSSSPALWQVFHWQTCKWGFSLQISRVITISASKEEGVAEKLPDRPLHWEGWWDSPRARTVWSGQGLPTHFLAEGWVRLMELSLPSVLQQAKLILAVCRHPSVLVGVPFLAPPGHPWAIYCFPALTVCSQGQKSNQIIPSLKQISLLAIVLLPQFAF